MAAVVVAGQQPLYELGAADLVVRQLDELSLVNLKQLFRNEAHVEGGGVRSPVARGRVLLGQLWREAGCTVLCVGSNLRVCQGARESRGRGGRGCKAAACCAQVEPEMQLETEEEAVFKPMALDDLW